MESGDMNSSCLNEPDTTNAAPPVQAVYGTSTYCHNYENLLPESDVSASTTLKSKRKERDSPEATEQAFSGPPEQMGANPPATRKKMSRTTLLTQVIATASAVVTANYDPDPLVSVESKTTEPKICGRCFKALKDIPALKRHCSEIHKQDMYGNPISIELFPCPITTCRKHTEPFKRREKLAQHIRASHTAINEGQDVNSGISPGKRDAALTSSNPTNAGNSFGGNYGAARMSAPTHHDSDEVGAWYPTVFGEPIDVQPTPVSNSCEIGFCYALNIPVDVNSQLNYTPEKPNVGPTSSFQDSALVYPSWNLPLEIDMSRTTGDAAEIPSEGTLDLNGVIDPALMHSFRSSGKLPNPSSPSTLPGLCSDLFRQIATGEWPVTVDKTVTVQYDTIDEAKQALLDDRKKILQKLQSINQQIEDLEVMKRKRNEEVEDLESVNGGFL